MFSIKNGCEDWQVRLLCPWARHLTGLTGNNKWQLELDSKIAKVNSQSPSRGNLANNEKNCKITANFKSFK